MNIHVSQECEQQLAHLAATSGKTVDEVLEQLVKEKLATSQPPQHSLLELRGLGKEIWEGVDPVQYINELRDDWGDW